jgi:general secretion pathway protein E
MTLFSQTLEPAADAPQPAFAAAPGLDPVSGVLAEARRRGATHVHLEPAGADLQVRLRIGGRLVELLRLPESIDLDIEHRGVEVARFGERLVLHLPAHPARLGELEALGMTPALVRMMAPVLAQGSGLVLVAGPAGSGRTTTLRALLRQLDDGTRNLLAVETADELREALRQDPDAILIGTLADREMARLAVQAVEAGHLVLAGVDSGDSVGAIQAMRKLRLEPFQLASTLRAVLAQRLVKHLCRDCRRPVQAQGSVSALLGFDPGTVVYAPMGCERCDGGFAGRIAVFEAVHADAPLRRLINDGCDGSIIARHAFLNAPNLGSAARALVREGVTTPEEAVRVSRG